MIQRSRAPSDRIDDEREQRGGDRAEQDHAGIRQREPRNERVETYRIAYDVRGVLWLMRGNAVSYRSGHDWHSLAVDAFGGDGLRTIKGNRAGAIDVLTNRGLWRIHGDSAPRRLLEGNAVVDVVSLEDGRTIDEQWTADRYPSAPGYFLLHTPGRHRDQRSVSCDPDCPAPLDERDVALRRQLHRTLPLAAARQLDRFAAGEERDRKGSLWVGSNALHQFPEPDTWARRDINANLRLEKTGATIWVGTSGNLHWIRRSQSGWSVGRSVVTLANMCTDSAGRTWTGHDPGERRHSVVEIRDSVVQHHYVDIGGRRVHGCTAARDGGVWLGTDRDLFHLSR